MRIERIGYLIPGVLVLALLFGMAGSARADTFDVNRAVGLNGTVVGTITTDGTLGALSAGNIVGFSLTITDLGGSVLLQNGVAAFDYQGGLIATATELSFDFASDGRALFQTPPLFNGSEFWCLYGGTVGCAGGTSREALRFLGSGNTISFTDHGSNTVVIATASTTRVPEPGTLALLSFGLAAVGVSRLRRRF